MWTALGPNGYLTVSGYDLSSAPAGTPSTVAEYAAKLTASLEFVAASAAANGGSYMVGIPAAASAHEFETFTLANGTTTHGAPQIQYAQAALAALAAHATGNAAFLGPALWGFSPQMEYPPHTNNTFEPSTPFVDQGEEAFLEKHLW